MTAHPDAARSPRHARLHGLFDAGAGCGLEIGPLHQPVVTQEHADVRYVDVFNRDGLLAQYSEDQGFPTDLVVEPDFVLMGGDGLLSLPDAVTPALPFDWVVASHVIEHVPDVVGWLREVAEVLVDDGVLVLAIPDRRFCFDVDREPTTVGQMLLAASARERRPNVRAVYDHFSRCMHIDTEHVWNGGAAGPRMYGVDVVQARMDEAARGSYVDCHVWVWTPASFVAQAAELAALDVLDFVVEQVVDTVHGDLEFSVRLRRLPRDLDVPGRAARRAAGVQEWTDVEPGPPVLPRPVGTLDDHPDAVAASLSPAEAQLVLAKRRLVHRARRLRSRVGR